MIEDRGGFLLVDYKTGRSDPDPLQLALYARAVKEIWGKKPECTWLLLRKGKEQSPALEDVSQLIQEKTRELKQFA